MLTVSMHFVRQMQLADDSVGPERCELLRGCYHSTTTQDARQQKYAESVTSYRPTEKFTLLENQHDSVQINLVSAQRFCTAITTKTHRFAPETELEKKKATRPSLGCEFATISMGPSHPEASVGV